jgi:predicted HTH domain antitoxin
MHDVEISENINIRGSETVGERQMSDGSVERSIELYRAEGHKLTKAAAMAGVPADDLADELRSRGVALRPEDSRGTTRTWY